MRAFSRFGRVWASVASDEGFFYHPGLLRALWGKFVALAWLLGWWMCSATKSSTGWMDLLLRYECMCSVLLLCCLSMSGGDLAPVRVDSLTAEKLLNH